MSAGTPIDEEVLDKLRSLGGDALVQRLVSLFLESSLTYMDTARQGLANGNLHEVETATHTLKSGAGSLGASEVYRLAEETERAARGEEAAAAASLFAQLEVAYGEACGWLRQEIHGSDADAP